MDGVYSVLRRFRQIHRKVSNPELGGKCRDELAFSRRTTWNRDLLSDFHYWPEKNKWRNSTNPSEETETGQLRAWIWLGTDATVRRDSHCIGIGWRCSSRANQRLWFPSTCWLVFSLVHVLFKGILASILYRDRYSLWYLLDDISVSQSFSQFPPILNWHIVRILVLHYIIPPSLKSFVDLARYCEPYEFPLGQSILQVCWNLSASGNPIHHPQGPGQRYSSSLFSLRSKWVFFLSSTEYSVLRKVKDTLLLQYQWDTSPCSSWSTFYLFFKVSRYCTP